MPIECNTRANLDARSKWFNIIPNSLWLLFSESLRVFTFWLQNFCCIPFTLGTWHLAPFNLVMIDWFSFHAVCQLKFFCHSKFRMQDGAYLFVRRDSVAVNLDVYLLKSETRQHKRKMKRKIQKWKPSITKHIHQFYVYSFSVWRQQQFCCVFTFTYSTKWNEPKFRLLPNHCRQTFQITVHDFHIFRSFSLELFINFDSDTHKHTQIHKFGMTAEENREKKYWNRFQCVSPVHISQTTNCRVSWNPYLYFCASWFHSKHSFPLCPIMFNVCNVRIRNDMCAWVCVCCWKSKTKP